MDYAESVIIKMREKYNAQAGMGVAESELKFSHMDMMNMSYDNGAFDIVIDKATMDVILTDNKDPWNPSEEVLQRSSKVLGESIRVLEPKGTFISISFDQPHFRKKLLLAEEFKT